MAYLFLADKNSSEDSDYGRYYEFNPESRKIFDKITILLSQRKNGDRKAIENQIALLCSESLKSDKKSNSAHLIH